MRSPVLAASAVLTLSAIALSACAQPAPPDYGQNAQPPGYDQGGSPPGYGQGGPASGYGQEAPPPGAQGRSQGWAGGMNSANGQPQGPSPDVEGSRGPAGNLPFREKFAAANVTHDGRLTQQQAQQAGLIGIARHFAIIDRDQKGYVTLEDIKEWRHATHAQKFGQQMGQPQAGQTQTYPGAAAYPPPPPPGQTYPPPSGQQVLNSGRQRAWRARSVGSF